MSEISSKQREEQTRVDAIFKPLKAVRNQARDTAKGIARMGIRDPEALTLDDIELLCRHIVDSPY